MKKQKGFIVPALILIIVVLIGGIIYYHFTGKQNTDEITPNIGEIKSTQNSNTQHSVFPQAAYALTPQVMEATKKMSTSTNLSNFDLEMEQTCANEDIQVPMSSSDVYQSTDTVNNKYIVSSPSLNFTLGLPGKWRPAGEAQDSTHPEDVVGGSSPENTLVFSTTVVKNYDPKCVEYRTATFDSHYTSGRFLSAYLTHTKGLLAFQDKGVVIINGIKYYWNAFKHTSTNDTSPELGTKYSIVFSAYKNGLFYALSFTGADTVSGSYEHIRDAAIKDLETLTIK